MTTSEQKIKRISKTTSSIENISKLCVKCLKDPILKVCAQRCLYVFQCYSLMAIRTGMEVAAAEAEEESEVGIT